MSSNAKELAEKIHPIDKTLQDRVVQRLIKLRRKITADEIDEAVEELVERCEHHATHYTCTEYNDDTLQHLAGWEKGE